MASLNAHTEIFNEFQRKFEPQVSENDLIEFLDVYSQEQTFQEWIANQKHLTMEDDTGASVAFKMANVFSRLELHTQDFLLSNVFSHSSVLKIESSVHSKSGRSKNSVGGALLLNCNGKIKDLIASVKAFRELDVLLSGRNSNAMVLNILTKHLSYKEMKEFINFNLDEYLSYPSYIGAIPAFGFAKDPEFLATKIHLSPEIYCHKHNNGYRFANLQMDHVFKYVTDDEIARCVYEFAMMKRPYPLIQNVNIIIARWSFNLLNNEIGYSTYRESPFDINEKLFLTNLCLSLCSSKETTSEVLDFIKSKLMQTVSDSNADDLNIMINEISCYRDFRGYEIIYDFLATLANERILNCIQIDNMNEEVVNFDNTLIPNTY